MYDMCCLLACHQYSLQVMQCVLLQAVLTNTLTVFIGRAHYERWQNDHSKSDKLTNPSLWESENTNTQGAWPQDSGHI